MVQNINFIIYVNKNDLAENGLSESSFIELIKNKMKKNGLYVDEMYKTEEEGPDELGNEYIDFYVGIENEKVYFCNVYKEEWGYERDLEGYLETSDIVEMIEKIPRYSFNIGDYDVIKEDDENTLWEKYMDEKDQEEYYEDGYDR